MNSSNPLFATNWSKVLFGIVAIFALLLSVGVYFLNNPQIARAAASTIFSDGFENTPSFSNPVWEQSDNKWVSNSSSERTGSRGAQVEGNTGGSDDVLKQEESTEGYENITLSYWFKVQNNLEANDDDRVRVQWYDGSTWTTLYTINSSDNGDGWVQKTHNLPAGADNNEDFAFRFVAKLDAGNDKVYIDDVSLTGDEIKTTVKIVKWIDADGDLGTDNDRTPGVGWEFNLDIDDEGNKGPYTTNESGMTEAIELDPEDEDEFDVIETLKDGYDLLSASCTGASDDNGTHDDDAVEGVEVEEGDEVVCTFINALDHGTLIVTKVVENDDQASDLEADDFSFTINGGDPIAFEADGSNEVNVPPGGFSVVEVTQSTHTVTYDGCTGDIAIGETKTCTITNNDIFEGGQGGDGDQCIETQMVVSDTLTLHGDDESSVILSFIHNAWTAAISGASWIWSAEPMPEGYVNDVTKVFTREFTVTGDPLGGELEIAADNSYEVTLNGDPLCSDSLENNFGSTDTCVIAAEDLVQGTNTLVFTVKNWAQNGGTKNSNPAGLLYKLSVDEDVCQEPEPEDPWCSYTGSVIAHTPDVDADQNDGDPVALDRRNVSGVENGPASYQNVGSKDGNSFSTSDFFSLGIGGYLVYEFSGQVAFDQAGNDIGIYEITGGVGGQTDEKILVEVSQDGSTWVSLGIFAGDALVDISPANLDFVKYVRITDQSQGIQGNNGDGYDVDAIVILQGSCGDELVAQCVPDLELLTNGGFEYPTVAPSNGANWDIFQSAPHTSGLGWIVEWLALTGDSNQPAIANLELQENGLFSGGASEGTQWTELDSDWNGHASGPNGEKGGVAISQTVLTEIGKTYTFSFDFSPRPNTTAAQNKVEFLVNNVSQGFVGPLAGTGSTSWTSHEFSFVATSLLSTVTLRDAGTPNDSLGTLIDKASLMCTPEPEAAPYCGDGVVNQEWEACDEDSDQCTAQCQVASDQCTEDIFARVVVSNVQNTGDGDATSDIYLGQGTNSIPQGTWFPVVFGGNTITDASISGYEDVPGLAVARALDGITVLLHGSRANKDVEHVEGYVEFFNSNATSQTSLTGQNKVEKPTDGKKKIKPGQDEIWLDSGLSHFWFTTTTADDGFVTSYAEALTCNPFATVTMCKYDEQNNPLSGWTLTLLGAETDEFAIPVNNHLGIDSTSLTGGTSYVALASGVWLNDRNPDNHADAEYSTEFGNSGSAADDWGTNTIFDGFPGFGPAILELEIDQTDGDWGPYNSLHQYAQMFIPSVDGSVNFRIFDGNTGTHTVNPGWYGDNKDSSLRVAIHEGYAGITEDNGCVVFNDVPFGTYVAGEVPQAGWTQIDGPLNPVEIDEHTESFTLVNTQSENVPETATLSATKIVCEAEEYLPNWGNGSGEPITASTAQDFLDEVNSDEGPDHCWLAPDWDFQWVTNTDSSSNPGNDLLTPAPSPWSLFDTSTNSNGVAMAEVPVGDKVWVREVLKENYIGFSGQNTTEDKSAELYCHTDALNYDNWDFINPVVADETYYCVAFNAPTPGAPELTIIKEAWDGEVGVDGQFTFSVTGPANFSENPSIDTDDGDGSTTLVLGAEGTYLLEELLEGDDWVLENLSCVYEGEYAYGQAINEDVYQLIVENGDKVTCTFVNVTDCNPETERYDEIEGACVPRTGENVFDLSVTKDVSHDGTPSVGETVTYTIVVSHTGDTAGSITVEDVLPSGVTPTGHTASNGNEKYVGGVWTIDSMTGGSATLTITATINSGEEGQFISNTARITGHDGDDTDELNDSDSASFTVESGGGGGGGDPEVQSFLGGGVTGLGCNPGGSVLGAFTSGGNGQVLGETCGLFLNQHLRQGNPANDPEQVRKLQEFLNKYGYGNFTPTGYFGPLTFAAVLKFQIEYAASILFPWNLSEPTGLVYLTTIRQINLLECPALATGVPELVPWSQLYSN